MLCYDTVTCCPAGQIEENFHLFDYSAFHHLEIHPGLFGGKLHHVMPDKRASRRKHSVFCCPLTTLEIKTIPSEGNVQK